MQVFFREVTLDAGESFSFVENLYSYISLNQAGSYIVQARLYPGLIRTASASSSASNIAPIVSNQLSLNLRPAQITGPDGLPLEMDEASGSVLLRQMIPPDEVVSYLLRARQKEQWEKFFLYLDLQSMMLRDAARNRQWQASSEEARQQMLMRYKTDLQAATVDGDIATIPTNFTIEQTVYNASDGTVTVLERFNTGNYTERKRYTYYLKRVNNVWTIIDYTVANLGTE
jgi:hypothetical protein